MDDVRGLVSELTEQGVLDSEGRFTVRSDEALRKLRESQLGDPYVYAVALFRAMVASGARRSTTTASIGYRSFRKVTLRSTPPSVA